MKKLMLLMLIICLAGAAQADMLTDKGAESGFEASTDDGYGSQVPNGFAVWASNWDGIDHENLYDVAQAHSGTGYWMLSGGGGSPCVGSVAGGVAVVPSDSYIFGAWIKAEAGNEPSVVEMGFDMLSGVDGAWLGNVVESITITTEWAYYEVTIDAWTNANAMSPKIAPFGDSVVAISGTLFTDDWTMINANDAGKALSPNPADGEVVTPDLDVLSWENAQDAVTVDVIFGVVGEPNAVIIDDQLVDSVVLSGLIPSIDIVSDKVYEWRVDTYNGTEVTEGTWWTFNTGNNAALPSPGPDQYIWLDGGVAVTTLDGNVTDDGKTPGYTVLWTLDAMESDPATSVIIDPNDAEITTVTIDNTGWYTFKIETNDGLATASAIIHVGVYGSPCEAATQDPEDIYNDYVAGEHGDINGDCKTDLADFAILASTWLDCMTPKLGCL